MRLVVYGTPAPQGSKAYLGKTAVGRGVIVDASAKTRPWRADVKAAAERYIKERGAEFETYNQPLLLRMVFSFIRPASVSRKKRSHPGVYPDLSKLARSTEDALTAAGVYRDDALIVEYARLAKVYVGEDLEALDRPGCLVIIRPMPVIELGPVPLQHRLALEAA